jgi:hypothetical protein
LQLTALLTAKDDDSSAALKTPPTMRSSLRQPSASQVALNPLAGMQ